MGVSGFSTLLSCKDAVGTVLLSSSGALEQHCHVEVQEWGHPTQDTEHRTRSKHDQATLAETPSCLRTVFGGRIFGTDFWDGFSGRIFGTDFWERIFGDGFSERIFGTDFRDGFWGRWGGPLQRSGLAGRILEDNFCKSPKPLVLLCENLVMKIVSLIWGPGSVLRKRCGRAPLAVAVCKSTSGSRVPGISTIYMMLNRLRWIFVFPGWAQAGVWPFFFFFCAGFFFARGLFTKSQSYGGNTGVFVGGDRGSGSIVQHYAAFFFSYEPGQPAKSDLWDQCEDGTQASSLRLGQLTLQVLCARRTLKSG